MIRLLTLFAGVAARAALASARVMLPAAMLRRPTRRFAWIALVIAALALPGPAMMGASGVPGVDPFFLCKAGGTGAAQDDAAPRDAAPGGGHASGHDHCPLCLAPAPAAVASDNIAAAKSVPPAARAGREARQGDRIMPSHIVRGAFAVACASAACAAHGSCGSAFCEIRVRDEFPRGGTRGRLPENRL